MSTESYGLRPGIVSKLREYLCEPSDAALAARLGLNCAEIQRARAAEVTGSSADRFVGEAMRVTAWPWQAFCVPRKECNAA